MIKRILERAKTIFKLTIKLVAVLLVVTVLYSFNLFMMKPFSVDHFLGKELILDLIESPEELTYVGILDKFDWITNHNSKLSIPQDDDIENDIKQIKKVIKTLYLSLIHI